MPQPYNYNPNVPDPTQAMIGAVNLGTNLTQLKAMQTQVKQAEAGVEQQRLLNADLAAVSKNPTTASVAQLMIKYPKLSEDFKRGYDALGTEQQKSKINNASQVYAALTAGDNDTAISTLKGYAEAYRNSGMEQDAKASESLAELVAAHPETAKTTAGLYLASAMGPDKFHETFSKLETERRERSLEPSKLTEAQAAAREAATKSKFSESNAVMDLQKKGWDIYKIQEDVKVAKENNRIAALNAAASKETNELKKQELQDKLKDAQMQRDQAVRDRAVSIESSRSTIDNSLGTIDRILQNPALDDVIGSFEGSTVGGVVSDIAKAANPLKWNSDDRANVQADIETLKSQTFLTQLQNLKNSSASGASGLGALSEKEGDRLISGIQSLATKQGEKQFKANLSEVQRLLLKSRKSITDKYGVPDTIPDTPNVKPTPEEIDALVQKHGG